MVSGGSGHVGTFLVPRLVEAGGGMARRNLGIDGKMAVAGGAT